ncbi:MAG: hypothetical protein ACRDTN_13920 [Mycobacterium sp.]
MATTMAAGALAMVTMAPQTTVAGPVLSSPVQLLSTASPLQPAIDQLLEAQQQVVGINSDYSFIVPSDLTRLPTYVQNLALTMFAASLIQQINNPGSPAVQYAPFVWNAPAAEPQGFITIPNPDDLYSPLSIDPSQTYVVTVDPGPGTADMTFTPNAGNGTTADFTPLPGGIDLANATANPDGSYSIIFSSTQPSGTPTGNWVDTAGADRVIVRDTLGNWGQIHDSISIQQEGVPATSTLPVLSDDQFSSLLSTVAANLVAQNAAGTYFNTQKVFAELPANTFSHISTSLSNVPNLGELGSVLPGQVSSGGHFVLEPDKALIVKVPDIQSSYSGFEVADVWAQNVPYATVQGSLNNTQAFHDPDGFTYYVISSQDPGVANWVDDSGLTNGGIFLRWQGVTDSSPGTSVQAEVVNVADVRDDLPADTPLVTAAERAADLQERLFEYDYAQDQTHSLTAWAGANLLYDQIKAAVGPNAFNEIFGGQQDVPSVLDRLTPALSPDPSTVVHDVLTNPGGSLSAVEDNLSLLGNDIELPIVLAAARLVVLVEQTAQAVQSDISSGDLSQALAALGTGVQGLGTVVNETLTDPATSITAGILNARDDLAVAIMNATSSTSPADAASLSDSLSQLAQSVSQLLDPSTALADLSAVLNPADLLP